MGWTSKGYNRTKHLEFNTEHAIELAQSEIETSGYKVKGLALKKARTKTDHNVIYTAIIHPNGKIFGMVSLVDIANNEIFWKDIDESMGPVEDEAPKSIIQMLSETTEEYANNWRVRCLMGNSELKTTKF